MPSKKPNPKPETEPAKAVVSKLGINDEPVPYEPKVVKTKNGNTITFN
jgi:hypothetical protein|tara:strand:+ start:1897 stop:2040 length:144 start_codon:yes stop_codon:yes gene_type:complete